ncbi:Proliferation-associated protein A [Auxenochlorella protothecoides]|uniref:Proliferation-associated protein A n=1 Tax=Auxenochlorella protothecoides TaxID=3075 RepID=A0A087SQD0_AUXPR|nr:Proliferation-associated protein A [Auxenochlorella protothecoides]KFM27934.1 Proliferation-associated protein A [Auxenochlorella protothecoides]
MSDYSSDSESRENESISNPDVVTKYKAAAKIVNDTLAAVIDAAKPGAKIVDLCTLGDKLITEAAAKEFKGKDIEKGIAVPTCVSVNNCIGHFSPPADNTATLKEGDVVKIDLGAHIDGFIAQAAHSLVAVDGPAKGRAADVVAAAHAAYEAASRLVRAGRRAKEVGPVLSKIAEAYGCTLVEGVLSHEMKRFIIDASKAADDFEIEEGEVYAIDIVMSTGEGKSKVVDEKETTVFKRALDVQYQLKIKASREVLSEINKKFPTMMYGLLECINHNLLQPFPVLYEKPDALVAHFKGTVLLVPSGVDRITNSTLQALESDKSIEDAEVKALLATSLKTKKKKKSKGEAPKAVEA